ncbi:SusD/RagB family nutrient-binding outer membrane lipoprotein [Pedobacter hiemivivus]|uniref:SusD/RagB family nutrient-binding outer membrane lipoprotein n=1 Tax=Pedobacter hiemivivus TaxID=2530454 RepID=A0A4R0N4T6_9SPHI|nr:SusD/RagB family nutrient-binding outer membrane lipoprotein [Pedobacter hiemivivus]TCC94959.1 SusD/RagB family nutrient-binding outer membrane lipoprotein [Pedobacter hiemivivus]
MEKRYKYLAGIALVCFSAILGSCQKNFLDINNDPKNPTDLPLTQILPIAEGGLAFNLSMNVGGLNSAASTFSHQIVNFRVNDYIVDRFTFQTPWSGGGATYGLYSGALQDFQTVINKGTAQNAPHFVGVAQVQKAYIFSLLVDLFGDVPYFDALKGNDALNPKFDGSSAIYDDLFKSLDIAIANLSAASSSISPDKTTDFIYGGDRLKWIKLANSIKLKLYNQIRLKQDVSAQMNALITAGNLILTPADDFQIQFGTSSAPENRNPGFVANYNSAGSRESSVSPYFYNTLKTLGDPRMPYFIYNQLATAGSPTDNAPDFKDGRFVSFRFSSKGPNANRSQLNSQSLLGLFPVGGRYDDGAGGVGKLDNGLASGALRLLTSYQVLFIQAEAALTIGTTGLSADTLLKRGIRANLRKVNAVAASVPGSVQSVPQMPSIENYITKVYTDYQAASPVGKLNIIMTQKWISTFGFGIDAYTDYRRTGYPVIPNTTGAGDPEVIATRTFPFRLPYPNSEVTSNSSFPGQPDPYTSKIFWAQ